MKKKTLCYLFMIMPCFLLLSGCAHIRNSVPEDLTNKIVIAGMPNVCAYIDSPNIPFMSQSLIDSFKEEGKTDYIVNGVKNYPALIISGGVSNSAYGVGVLKGWSKEGSRPVFKIVTGVSSGGIVAIFAFLGEDYDGQLEELFTSISTKDIVKQKSIVFSLLFGDSLMSSKPLAKKIEKVIDEKLLGRIAEEHKKGRRLYVGTTDLDAQKFVIWDMGAIASIGSNDSAKMFRKIILASCALPIITSPVYFPVKADDKSYDQMHSDGAATMGIFYIYQLLESMECASHSCVIDPGKFRSRLYILCCSNIAPHSQQVGGNLASIASRALDTYGSSKMIGETYRIYTFAKEKGWDYNLAYIPDDFRPDQKEMFDKQEMRRLFRRGYEDAAIGYKWHKAPPGLVVSNKWEIMQKSDSNF
jgi:hypothetical protein